MHHGQEVLRSLEAAVKAMKEATLQHPGNVGQGDGAREEEGADREEGTQEAPATETETDGGPAQRYELALELLSGSSESMTAPEIHRSLSKQGQGFAHQAIVYGLEKLVDTHKAKRRKTKGRVRYRAIPEEPAAEESATL